MKESRALSILLDELPMGIGMVSLVLATTITGINVVTRYFFKYTYAGTSEVIAIAFAWLIFSGTAYAYKQGKHYGIDMLVEKVPKRLKTYLELLCNILLVFIFVICVALSLRYTVNVHTSPLPALQISYAWFYIPGVYGFSMMLVYSVRDLLLNYKQFKAAREGEKI